MGIICAMNQARKKLTEINPKAVKSLELTRNPWLNMKSSSTISFKYMQLTLLVG